LFPLRTVRISYANGLTFTSPLRNPEGLEEIVLEFGEISLDGLLADAELFGDGGDAAAVAVAAQFGYRAEDRSAVG
jgi:hypothetical protein